MQSHTQTHPRGPPPARLMDSSQPAIKELLEFSCVRPLCTVGSFLEAAGAAALMDDPLVRRFTGGRGGRSVI